MRTYSGPFLTEKGFIQAEITIVDEGNSAKVVDFQEGGDTGKESIIIPTPFNAHVHTGDSVVKDPPKGSIAEIVGPGGFKHKILEETNGSDIIRSMREYITKAMDEGTRHMIDFREGGLVGIEQLTKAMDDMDFNMYIFSRPKNNVYDDDEFEKLISSSHGIGISSYRDWDHDQLHSLAEESKRNGIPLALHCSEDVREPIDEVLELGVHHLVHMIEANKDDLESCASEKIPVVVCPRSNEYFEKRPNIPALLQAGITVCLGTDNAMLASSDMFQEMKATYRLFKESISPLDVVMMATWNPRKALNPSSFIGMKSTDHCVILEKGNNEPAYDLVTKIKARDILEVVEW